MMRMNHYMGGKKLKLVMASAAEAEVGELFHNANEAIPIITTLDEL